MNDFVKDFLTGDFKSEYSHDNRIDIVDGRRFFQMDCSGFVYWVLDQSGYRRALVEVRAFLRKHNFIKINRLFCKDFAFVHEHAGDFKYWQFVNNPVKNCILVVVFPDGNGHCMFVDEIIGDDKNELCLRVIDSTRYPHQNDSRGNGETGIGVGEIILKKAEDKYIYDSKNAEIPPRMADVSFVMPKK